MSPSLLLIKTFLADFQENLILIFLFIVSYLTLNLFKKEISKEEKLNRQKLAEEYLKSHQMEDEEFLFSN